MCVEKFDHHCPWIGTCIGKNNYVKFIAFLYTTISLAAFDFGICILKILDAVGEFHGNPSSSGLMQEAGAGIIIGAIITLALVLIGGLGAFHCFLIGSGMTTAETLKKYVYYEKNNPFLRKSFWENLKEIGFSRTHKLFRVTEEFEVADKDFCNICTSQQAIKKVNYITDFEITINSEIHGRCATSVIVTPST